MSNIRWGARYDPGLRTWVMARADRQGGVLQVARLRFTCEALLEADGHLEFFGEVLVNGSTVDIVREPVKVADSAWVRHLVKCDQVVKVEKVSMGSKAQTLVRARIVQG